MRAPSHHRLHTIIFMALLLWAVPSFAGIGQGSSQPILVDTLPPVIHLIPLPEHFLINAGQTVTFQWSGMEDNPSFEPEDYIAEVFADGEVLAQINWDEGLSGYTWEWLAPEIQTPNCHLEVTARDIMGNSSMVTSEEFTVLFSTTGVDDLPQAPLFSGPYPNPFNPSCTMDFNLPQSQLAEVTVFDARGRLVQTLFDGPLPAGHHSLQWKGTDSDGRPQSGGVYFFLLKTGEAGQESSRQVIRKATLIP